MTSTGTELRTATVVQAPPRSRPRTEYWDHLTATWQVASPIPAPRRGR